MQSLRLWGNLQRSAPLFLLEQMLETESDAPSQGATMVRDSVVERHFSPFLLNFDLLYFTFDP